MSGESDISEEYSWNDDYTLALSYSEDNESHDSEKSSKEDYEEERPKISESYNFSKFRNNPLKNYQKYPIDFDIKKIAARIERKIEISNIERENLNHTLLFASIVILAKSGNKIDDKFPKLCDEIIETVVKCDIDLENKDDKDNKIEQLKRDILRYCRFVQLKT
jgi:hypothetical protein